MGETMAEHVIRELEEAARIILAPANYVTSEQRNSAEAVFLKFRKTKSPYQLCRQILETSPTDYLLFESVGLLKTSLVQEWTALSEEDIASLKLYLLHYLINRPTLAPFVRARMVQVIVIIIKKGSVADVGKETCKARDEMLDHVENLVMNGDLPKQVLGCSIMSTMIQEYGITTKSSAVALTQETHVKLKAHFEATALKRIFKFCIGILSELLKKDKNENTMSLLKNLLPIVESVLVWGSALVYPRLSEQEDYPALKPGPKWRDVFLDSEVLDLFFRLYWELRSNPQLAHHVRTCLLQLASLSGLIFENDSAKLKYATDFMERFFKLLSNIEIIDQEAHGMANIARKFVSFFLVTLKSMPESNLKLFMEEITRLICFFIRKAAQEESLSPDDCLYMQALEVMLELWSCILSYPLHQEHSIQIFDAYVLSHLSPPEGVRTANSEELNSEDIQDIELDDKERFRDQLQTIGHIGMQVPDHALGLLAALIEDRIDRLSDNLNKMVGQTHGQDTFRDNYMVTVYEDLHWLLLIASYVICMDLYHDVHVIPLEIKQYSIQQGLSGRVDADLTLQFWASSQNVRLNPNVSLERVDRVIRLVANVFRLCAIEKVAMSVNLMDVLSPELSCTIMWFLYRWAQVYLLPEDSLYDDVGIVFSKAFGKDGSGASWAINFLVEKIECNVNMFKSEPAVIRATIELLIVLTHREQKAACVFKSERFPALVEMATKSRHGFPQELKRGLWRGIVRVGIAVEDNLESFWSQTVDTLQATYKQITSNENFLKSYHQEETKFKIEDTLDAFIGVLQGVQVNTAASLFNHTYPILVDLPNLLSLYQNYQNVVELILELLDQCVTAFVCGSLQIPDQLYELCFRTIREFVQCSRNRLTLDKTAEEDRFEDVSLLMEVLTKLLGFDMIFFAPPNVVTTDSFLCNLNIIMRIISLELLKYPTLCLKYFKMLSTFCTVHPEKICAAPDGLLPQLLMSFELGLFSFGSEVTGHCCKAIESLARDVCESSNSEHDRRGSQLIAPCLNFVMTLVLSHQLDSYIIQDVGGCLFYLICCSQQQYQQLVQNILSSQTDQRIAERLAEAFTKLTRNVDFSSKEDRYRRVSQFNSEFERFIDDVQGFLMVK